MTKIGWGASQGSVLHSLLSLIFRNNAQSLLGATSNIFVFQFVDGTSADCDLQAVDTTDALQIRVKFILNKCSARLSCKQGK